MATIQSTIQQFASSYSSTPAKIKIIDAYLAYVLLTGVAQFAYCMLVGTFPFNSFLSGFISSVGCFVLTGTFLQGSIKKNIQNSLLFGPRLVLLFTPILARMCAFLDEILHKAALHPVICFFSFV